MATEDNLSLAGLTVIEISGSVAGSYCAKMFADQGADVTVIGPSQLGPHQQAYFDAAKRVSRDQDWTQVDFASVDVVIESSAPDPLVAVPVDSPNLVRVQISPFGNRGEHAHWKSTDFTDYALSGHSYLYGDPDREPLRGPPDQPAVASGLFGFVGAMAALLARGRLGGGQTVDVSHFQVMTALHQVTLLQWEMTRSTLCRMGNRYTGVGQPNGSYRCRDGWIAITCVTPPQVEGLLAVSGLLHLLEHPEIDGPMDFQQHPQLIDEPLQTWLGEHTVAEVVELFQAMRIPAAPLLDPGELLSDQQLIDRNFFVPLTSDPERLVPGPPFTITPSPGSAGRHWQPGETSGGPLSGLKVLDMARVWAGPLCARILRDLGADVVWVESPWNRGPQDVPQAVIDSTRYFPDDQGGDQPWNRNGHFVKYSLGKQSLALDLMTEAGRDVFAQLVPQFHVLLENFTPRVMPQFGFDQDRLHELNPDLVYLTMPGYGRSGPAKDWLAYGSCIDSHAGLSALTGYHDQAPWKGGIAWPDPIAGLHACSAVLSVLWRSQHGEPGGAVIEAAQFESTIAAIGDRVLEAQIDGPFVPQGHRESAFVAQGMYPCAGVDSWLAISVPDDRAYAAVVDVLGLTGAPHPRTDPDAFNPDEFDHDAFDRAVAQATVDRDAAELAALLQEAGVPAAKATTAADVLADPHLRSIDNWQNIDQPEIGDFIAPITPLTLTLTPLRRPIAAPTLGQHNRDVLLSAGLPATAIDTLVEQGIVVTMPPG